MKNLIIGTKNHGDHGVVGLFSFVNNMASSIWHNRFNEKEINFFYDISGNSPYYDKNIKETNNVWEYYFEQPAGILYSERKNVGETYGSWSSFNGGNTNVGKFQTPPQTYKNQKEELKNISDFIFNMAKNKIKLKKEIVDLIEKTKASLNLNKTKYISIHHRNFTWKENIQHNPHQSRKIDIENWFKEIDKLLKPNYKIFLATDSEESIKIFKKRYGDKIINLGGVERLNNYSVEDINKNPLNIPVSRYWTYEALAQQIPFMKNNTPYESGLYAIIDCWLLSGGETLIKHFSGMSFFSTLINPKIDVINIDQIY